MTAQFNEIAGVRVEGQISPTPVPQDPRISLSSRLFLLLTLPLPLVFLWLASDLFYPDGFYYFFGGTLLLFAAALACWLGYPRALFLYYKTVFMLAVTGALLEFTLWAMPGLLTGQAANQVYTGYGFAPEGIYQHHRHLGAVMRPNHSRWMYWSGHWWHHRTNKDGYRGEAVARCERSERLCEAIFLGDSMVYGHGVEANETVASRFAERTQTRVANLGQQGTSLVQMWLRLKQLGPQLRPRYVFVCSHYNDMGDVPAVYPPRELRRFLDEEDYLPECWQHYWPDPSKKPRVLWNRHVRTSSRTVRLIRFLAFRVHRIMTTGAPPAGGGKETREKCYVPCDEILQLPFAPWEAPSEKERMSWQAHVRSLQQMKQWCKERGAQLVLFDLGYPHTFSNAIRKQAKLLEVPYVPAGQAALQRALEGEPVYLANDGHWTPHGSDIVARELANWWQQEDSRCARNQATHQK